MQLEKKYEFSHNRQLWRLIPDESGKIIIEERNTDTKEVFFNCLDINSGNEIFSSLQMEEKFWIGVETIYKEIIFFHKYQKPEMPGHKGIIAFDIASRETLWANSEYSYLFVKDEKIYCYEPLFEGRKFYTLNYKTGEILEDLGNAAEHVNSLMEKENSPEKYRDYVFPEVFDPAQNIPEKAKNIINSFREERVIAGKIDFAVYGSLLIFNAHEVMPDGKLSNIFRAYNHESKTLLVNQVLNKSSETYIPDSFFIKEELLFVLIEKVSLVVYKIKS
jgi:hypothetical protein